ncbi:hypothetical protein [Streptomyces sp. SID13726]|uniref:hypothetical protein n=1 Tax=Streptomyces sp. SID13726 TaxID=2706058 RepID=UPI0013B64091|nr:hypothetical protein [Streptomyces sp. SID13726]NEB04499.1 hypothetical protein [Streptomyces sp. SID13726]
MSEATELETTPLLLKFGAWMEHCVPHEGKNCAECLAGKSPRQGCDVGVALYEEYRAEKQRAFEASKEDK